jgi:hypothetical protein
MKRSATPVKFRCANGIALLCLLLVLIAPGCKQEAEEPDSNETSVKAPIVIKTAAAAATAVPVEPSGEVFEMEEVSVFDIGTPMAFQLQMGQPARECAAELNKQVKTYPEFKSDKPFYGRTTFDMSLVQYGVGTDYYFAVDESGGTGKGYDRLYFDANHDLDLTNDGVLSPMENPPGQFARMGGPNSQESVFDYLEFDLDRGPGKPPVPLKVMPRFMLMSTRPMVTFVTPTARKGKIKLGSEELEAVLSQSGTITGSYASPTTGLFLGNTSSALPFLCGWRNVNGTFYTFSSTASGDKLTVTPYTGPFGGLGVAARGSDGKAGTVELGYLIGENTMLDIGKCRTGDGTLRIPVGDYRPFRLALRLGDLRVGLGLTMPNAGEAPAEPPKFAIKIRENQSCLLNLGSEPEIVFRTPGAGDRFKVGSEIKVEAVVNDPAVGASLSALDDTTQKIGTSIRMPDGTDYQRFQSLDPVVKVTNSSGERVASGKMPFG